VGGGSKKQTIGYEYYLGMHFVLCHGPIDYVSKIRVDDKIAWQGGAANETIFIDNRTLFGGQKREGGIEGFVDFDFGGSTQLQNSYLVDQLGPEIPAYRGVVSAVLNQVYVGINPYLKKWTFEATRVYNLTDGSGQWNPGVAALGFDIDWSDTAVWIASDNSGSMVGSKLSALKIAVIRLIQAFRDESPQTATSDLHLREWADGPIRSDGEWIDLKDPTDFSAATSLVASYSNNLGANTGTDFSDAFDGSNVFFNNTICSRKVFIFITDGEPTQGQLSAESQAAGLTGQGVEIYVFLIEDEDTSDVLGIDSTPEDGIGIAKNATDLKAMLRIPFLANGGGSGTLSQARPGLDMNPAHIIRECLTNSEWGMGYQETDIDDVSFTAAASLYADENIGMSLLWDKEVALEAFIADVLRHVDTSLYVSRTTGQFVLKPIRGDYNVGSLVVLDESNISSVSNQNRTAFGELSNSVTINFYNRAFNREDTVTVSDTALVQDMGELINAGITYRGITNKTAATKLAWRDLKTLSSALFSCELIVDQTAKDFEIGDVFKFSWAEWDIVELVMRVTNLSFGDGIDNKIRVTCTEDVFATPTQLAVISNVTEWVDPSQAPGLSDNIMADEVPYIELVKTIGQTDIDTILSTQPEAGYVFAAAQRAPSAINATMWTDNGSGYDDASQMDFAPHGFLKAGLGFKDNTLYLSSVTDLDSVEVGTYCQIGENPNNREFCRIDSVDTTALSVGIGRGCYDLPPREHNTGTNVWFFDNFGANDEQEYVSGETIDVKVTPISGVGVVDLSDAEEVSVTLNQRPYRPYAPGDLQIDLESYPDIIPDGELSLSWVGRDRTEQTSGAIFDHFAANIGPEAGVTYRVRGYEGGVLTFTQDPATSPQTWTPSESGLVRIEVDALRDGVYSYQTALFEFGYGADWMITEIKGERRNTEAGEIRMTED